MLKNFAKQTRRIKTMFKNLTGLMAAATVIGAFAAMAPANAAALTTTSTSTTPKFTWENLTTHQVKDRSTDTSGFQKLIPDFQKYVQQEKLQVSAEKLKAQKFDATQLFLNSDHNVRVWFLNEGADYKNQLGYQTIKNGKETGRGEVFNNLSCITGCQRSNGNDTGVLDIGDYVDIGKVSAGTQLNFLLRSNGFNGGKTVLGGANPDENVDKLQHLMTYKVGDYLLMGFEDIVGKDSDFDFNDAVFVVDFGKNNLVTAIPEPGNMAALLGVTGAAVWMRRRKSQVKVSA